MTPPSDTPTVTPAERTARIRLARSQGVGPVAMRRLLARFGSAARALEALPGLAASSGRAEPRIPTQAQVEDEIARVEAKGGSFLVWGEPAYPPLLAAIDDPPPALAVLGDPARLALPTLAIVGARNASANACTFASRLAHDLSRAGFAIVSGLARGIDAAAHQAVLDAAGVTFAAVAGGLDQPYPPENAGLQAWIAETGLVLAEAPWGTAPQSRHFPKRNRIIAGLAIGTIVVEAELRSGSLITAHLAAEAGRELFAVPGSPLDPRARGTNDLIRQGAVITEGADDVLARIGSVGRDQVVAQPPDLDEPDPDPDPDQDLPPDPQTRAEVLALLGPAPVAVDEIIRRCHLSAAAVQDILLDLDLAGRLEWLPGNRVALVSP